MDGKGGLDGAGRRTGLGGHVSPPTWGHAEPEGSLLADAGELGC
jgi:hypothetical protein